MLMSEEKRIEILSARVPERLAQAVARIAQSQEITVSQWIQLQLMRAVLEAEKPEVTHAFDP